MARLGGVLDPADRILAATAQVLGSTLVTAYERLLGLGEIQTLANRRCRVYRPRSKRVASRSGKAASWMRFIALSTS